MAQVHKRRLYDAQRYQEKKEIILLKQKERRNLYPNEARDICSRSYQKRKRIKRMYELQTPEVINRNKESAELNVCHDFHYNLFPVYVKYMADYKKRHVDDGNLRFCFVFSFFYCMVILLSNITDPDCTGAFDEMKTHIPNGYKEYCDLVNKWFPLYIQRWCQGKPIYHEEKKTNVYTLKLDDKPFLDIRYDLNCDGFYVFPHADRKTAHFALEKREDKLSFIPQNDMDDLARPYTDDGRCDSTLACNVQGYLNRNYLAKKKSTSKLLD